MENYDLDGVLLEGKKAVIAVGLPELAKNNKYGIYDIYNVSDQEANKIVIHFKDFSSENFSGHAIHFESFIIDFNNLNNRGFLEIDFNKEILVAFHHENDILKGTPKQIFDEEYNPIYNPDSTGKGTIRESV